MRRMKASFTSQCQPLPNCAQIPSMVSLPYPVCGNSSHPFAAVSLSWLGLTGIVFWTGCTIVCPLVDMASFVFGTWTSRQGRRLIIPSYFWRKGATYSCTWLVKVLPTAHRRVTYSCLAQRNLNSVLLWLQHKLWANLPAHEPLWEQGQSQWPSPFLCMNMDVLGRVSIRVVYTQRLHFVILPNTSLSQAIPIKKACNNIPNYILLWWEI